MKTRPRLDSIHAEVVEMFRRCGDPVLSLAALGNGVSDLLVNHRGTLHLVEVKTGLKSKLRPAQQRFFCEWPVHVCRSADDALALVRAWDRDTRHAGGI